MYPQGRLPRRRHASRGVGVRTAHYLTTFDTVGEFVGVRLPHPGRGCLAPMACQFANSINFCVHTCALISLTRSPGQELMSSVMVQS